MTTKELIHKLRSTVSVSKRSLLDEAADTIEQLLADLKATDRREICDFCVHGQQPAACFDKPDWVVDCELCGEDCPCKTCWGASGFEWRGITGGQ